jgi:pyrroloquinoline-quinone synthase
MLRRERVAEQHPWNREEFERKLREKERFYHVHHPFQVLMNSGKLNQRQIQGWVANRFYYQTNIPIKDAAILANCPQRSVRHHWVRRILDHDGYGEDAGGIEAWLQLGKAAGLAQEELESQQHVLPGVRFAVDAYVNFARRATWQEAVCSSLTELFAPSLHQQRLDNWPQHYPWIKAEGYHYFRQRLNQAQRDVQYGLEITLDYFQSHIQQQQALAILQFKLDVLWTMLDAMWMAYIENRPPYRLEI